MKNDFKEFFQHLDKPDVRAKLESRDFDEMCRTIDLALVAYPKPKIDDNHSTRALHAQLIIFARRIRRDEFISGELIIDKNKIAAFTKYRIQAVKRLKERMELSNRKAIGILFHEFSEIVYFKDKNKAEYTIRVLLGFLLVRTDFVSANIVKKLENDINKIVNLTRYNKRAFKNKHNRGEFDNNDNIKIPPKLLKRLESLVRF